MQIGIEFCQNNETIPEGFQLTCQKYFKPNPRQDLFFELGGVDRDRLE